MNYCGSCGSKIIQDSKFCGNCGIEYSHGEVNPEEKNETREFIDNAIKERIAKEKRGKVEKDSATGSEKKQALLMLAIYLSGFVVFVILMSAKGGKGWDKIDEWIQTILVIPIFILIGGSLLTIITNIWTSYGRQFLYSNKERMFYKFSTYALIGGIFYLGFGFLGLILI